MAVDPQTLDDPQQVRNLLHNAERLAATELARACKRRLYELSGEYSDDPVEVRLWKAVAALEESYLQKHGRKQVAGYTRRKIRDKGAVATLSDWALKTEVTPGFEALIAEGLAEFTGEHIIIDHPDRFEQHVVVAAKRRLSEYGVQTE